MRQQLAKSRLADFYQPKAVSTSPANVGAHLKTVMEMSCRVNDQ
jgi:hypothetical protein